MKPILRDIEWNGPPGKVLLPNGDKIDVTGGDVIEAEVRADRFVVYGVRKTTRH